MAEKEPPAPPNAEKKIEADIYSREFDPVVALYSNNFKPPSLTAPTFDNIEAFVRKGCTSVINLEPQFFSQMIYI